MRIIFFGSDPWFSPPVLSALLAAGHQVPVVVTKGKKSKEFMDSLIHKILKKKLSDRVLKTLISQKIRVVKAKTEEDISLKRLKTIFSKIILSRRNSAAPDTRHPTPDTIVLASFGPPFLPAEVLQWPKYGCLNVHASLLPRWRGASPVFAALAAGDRETGVSIMRMTQEIDRGPVLGQAKIIIRSDLGVRQGRTFSDFDTRETLTKRLGKLGGELIVKTLKKLETGQVTETPQPQKSPTPYTRRLTKKDGRINWSQSPIQIERFIRAASPWPGAWTEFKEKGKRKKVKGNSIKILKAELQFLYPSSFILLPSLVQLPGKNPITWKQFLAGRPGVKLG